MRIDTDTIHNVVYLRDGNFLAELRPWQALKLARELEAAVQNLDRVTQGQPRRRER